ncbi:MAG TPA: hypothetical protein VGM51_18020 [Armatimonadota bacterium]|jgi:hypothetical protein
MVTGTITLILMATVTGAAMASAPGDHAIKRIDPPEQGFYAKEIDCDGILIKAPAEVSDAAILEAARRISRVLEHIPVVRRNLAAVGAEHHIIGKDQQTSDLPEWRQMKGKPHWDGSASFDQRTRGMGGLVSSSGEENLLKLPSDRYKDHRDICSHEFSHGILGSGVSPEIVRKFEEQRQRSTAKGLWKSYAGTNTQEFFAELTMWYFGTRGDYGSIQPKPEPGRAWFRRYDPEAYALFDSFYSGRLPVPPIKVVRIGLSARKNPVAVAGAPSKASVVIVQNNTAGSIKTYMIAGDGTRQQVDTIPPGGRYDNNAHASGQWEVTDQEGKSLGFFTAPASTGLVIVSGRPSAS